MITTTLTTLQAELNYNGNVVCSTHKYLADQVAKLHFGKITFAL